MTATAPHPVPALAAAGERNRSLWDEWHARIDDGRLADAFELWTEDGHYEVVYPVEGMPAVVEGREALVAVFGGFAQAMTTWGRENVRFHQTLDPDVAIVEYTMRAELVDGSVYDNRLILRFTFRDGRFAEVLEYYGEIAHGDVLRRLGVVS